MVTTSEEPVKSTLFLPKTKVTSFIRYLFKKVIVKKTKMIMYNKC